MSQAALDAIDAAIESGTLTVKHGDKQVTYQSLDKLLTIRARLARKLASPKRKVASVAVFHSGD